MKKNKQRRLFWLIATLAISIFTLQGIAQERVPTPEERAFAYRDGLFQTFGFKFGRLIAAKVQNDADLFKKQAGDLLFLANLLEEGFEIPNSLPEGTRAKPEIWEDFEDFQERAEILRAATAELTKDGAMESFDPRQFGSENCGGCHRKFRTKED